MTKAATVHVPAGIMLWARKRAAVDIRDAAKRADHDLTEVQAWEAGDDPPLSALRELATLYGLPLSAFLLTKPKDEPLPTVDQRKYAGIDHPTTTPGLARALHRAAGLQVVASELLDALDAQPFAVVAENVDPDWLAAQERAALGITIEQQLDWGDEGDALREWRAAIEARGAIVMQMSLSKTDVRAFSLRADPPVIVLDRSDWVRAKIFSLAHEFGHVVVGGAGICVPGSTRASGIEAYCNRFADALLLPPDAITSDPDAKRILGGGPASDNIVKRIANRFKVSPAVVWYRLHQVKFIDDAVFDAGWGSWSVWRPPLDEGGGPSPTAKNVVRDYGVMLPDLLLKASHRGLLNDTDVSQYLAVEPSTLPSIESEIASRLAR